MSGAFCSDCKRQTDVVLDHSAGNAMCSECGLILESHSTDETPEWRIFADADGPSNKDPAPVGGPTNPLLDDTAFSTPVPKRKRTSRESPSSSGSISEWNLMLALQTIATIADRLGLVATIKDRANDIRKRLGYFKSSHWKNQDALLAACLYIACRQEVKPITINEISSVVNGATKTDIGRAKDYILKQLGLEEGESVEMGTIHAGDLITRFCSHLGMNDQATKAAQESVQKLEEIYIKRSPISTAAVLIYIITQLSDDKKPLEDISLVAGIAEGTIKTSYWDVYPHISKIIPSWYATEEDLKNLSNP